MHPFKHQYQKTQALTIGPNNVPSEALATGDGTTKTFSGTLAHSLVYPHTVTITAGAVTATDSVSGVLSGTGVSGTINYATGAWSLTYTTAPANATAITATYSFNPQSQAFGAQTYAVRLVATSACHVEFGPNPSAQMNSALIAPNTFGEVVGVAPGSKVSVIQDTAAGKLYVTELTQ